MATYALARSHGAGTVLVNDKRQHFKISDWSNAAGAVYGWPCSHKGEPLGKYQRLPDGLQLAEGESL